MEAYRWRPFPLLRSVLAEHNHHRYLSFPYPAKCFRSQSQLITAPARGEVRPEAAGVDLPANVIFPVNYTISMKRVFELARQALDRYPMLEAQALGTVLIRG
jgi:hypothetical protein